MNEYSGNPEGLRSYAEKVVGNAKTFLPLDISEINRKSPGVPKTDKTQVTYFSVLMPDSSGYEEFASQLGQELIGATGFGGGQDVILNPSKKNEITLVCVRNVLPGRYSKAIAMLRKKYDARMAQVDGTPHAMELHGEGDGTQFPSLFVKSVSADDVRPYVLIAQAVGLVRELEDPDTELKSIYLVTKNEKGRPNPPEKLGENLLEVLRNAGQNLMDQLQDLVEKVLATDYLAKSKRDELANQINAEAERLLQQGGGNPLNREYKSFCTLRRICGVRLLPPLNVREDYRSGYSWTHRDDGSQKRPATNKVVPSRRDVNASSGLTRFVVRSGNPRAGVRRGVLEILDSQTADCLGRAPKSGLSPDTISTDSSLPCGNRCFFCFTYVTHGRVKYRNRDRN